MLSRDQGIQMCPPERGTGPASAGRGFPPGPVVGVFGPSRTEYLGGSTASPSRATAMETVDPEALLLPVHSLVVYLSCGCVKYFV